MMRDLEVIELAIGLQACRMCGARRGRSEPDSAWIIDIDREWKRHEVRVVRAGSPDERYVADERRWSRRHVDCAPTATAVIEAVTGVVLPEEDARDALREHGVSLLAGDRDASQARPWGHLGTNERAAVTRIAQAIAAPPVAAPHRFGRCGICGVGSSTAWMSEAGVSWSDGTSAPLCSACTELVGVIRSDDLLEIRALAALAGMKATPSLHAHDNFRFRRAAAVLKPDERHDPDATRWGYRPDALEEVRTAAREALPELILDPAERAAGVERLLARRAHAATVEAARKNETTPGGNAQW